VTTPDDSPALSTELRTAVMRLARRLRQERAADELSEPQTSVVLHLFREGPLTPAALSAWAQVSPPSMNRTLNALEDAALIERARSDDDRRMVHVSVTDAGRTIALETRRRREAWLDRRLDTLDAHDRDVLGEAATIIRRLIEQ